MCGDRGNTAGKRRNASSRQLVLAFVVILALSLTDPAEGKKKKRAKGNARAGGSSGGRGGDGAGADAAHGTPEAPYSIPLQILGESGEQPSSSPMCRDTGLGINPWLRHDVDSYQADCSLGKHAV